MATVDDALQSQIRNIEKATGRSAAHWTALIRATGLAKHAQIVAWLKSEHGLTHGNANRLAIDALNAPAGSSAGETGVSEAGGGDAIDMLYAGDRAGLRPIHDRLMGTIEGFGGSLEVSPKKGYVSVRRRTQFAMLKPAAKHVDLGLILPGVPAEGRLETAGSFNAMFSHRVRVASEAEIDDELIGWLRTAWDRAG